MDISLVTGVDSESPQKSPTSEKSITIETHGEVELMTGQNQHRVFMPISNPEGFSKTNFLRIY